ncbi:D-alanyl-D-alanine carboxypeptidase family protein [Erysipelothrix urinaevulpis]|uniref:M15 family metallopeptidase n=1 Tax=Erysipelothrix urinaevulpis TaxID=2683717 RepID=UPI00135860BB|nr:M15 family metallopeptidase [Erysipelothrix urinaevulpis]
MRKKRVLLGTLTVIIISIILGIGYKLNKVNEVDVEVDPYTVVDLETYHQELGLALTDLKTVTINEKTLTNEAFVHQQKEVAKEYSLDYVEGKYIAVTDATLMYKNLFIKTKINLKLSDKNAYDIHFYFDNERLDDDKLEIESLDELENLSVKPCQIQFGECKELDELQIEENNLEIKEGKQTVNYQIKGLKTKVEKKLEITYTLKQVVRDEEPDEVTNDTSSQTKPQYQKKQALYLGKPYVYINREYGFDANYVPANIVYFPDGYSVDTGYRGVKEMVDHFVLMNDALKQETGLWMLNTSSYRNYEFQNRLYSGYVNDLGQKEADRISARPGHSEHQTGLVVDVTTPGGSMWTFGQTKQYQWVKENGHRFGFIIRYPEGKEHITKYAPEAWHLRYVGKDYAEKVYRSNLTFDEIINP